MYVQPQELEVPSLIQLYSHITKSSRCPYVVMTRSQTKLWVDVQAPVSGQSAVNVVTATSKCSITFFYVMIKMATLRENRAMSQIHFKSL